MNYVLYTHDVTCDLRRWNNEGNDIYKKGQWKLKQLKKNFFNKFCIIFHFLSICVSISIQNIGWSIPLSTTENNIYNFFELQSLFCWNI